MPKRFIALVLGHDGLSFVHVGDLITAATYQQVGVGKSAERNLEEFKLKTDIRIYEFPDFSSFLFFKRTFHHFF